jgi:DNA repair protein RecO (recombination protein O)
MPTGEALLSGLYLNELLMRLLARDDPHPACSTTTPPWCACWPASMAKCCSRLLRSFELLLLREIGLLPALDVQTMTWRRCKPAGRYALVPEGGLRAARSRATASLSGAQWLRCSRRCDDGASLHRHAARLRRPWPAELKPQLRGCCNTIAAVPVLRTRQLMMDLQSL